MGLISHGRIEELRLIITESERLTMIFTRSVLIQSLLVFAGSVSFILSPVVLRKFAVQLLHIIIAIGFGKYTGRCDGRINAISLDNTLVRNFFILRNTVPIV